MKKDITERLEQLEYQCKTLSRKNRILQSLFFIIALIAISNLFKVRSKKDYMFLKNDTKNSSGLYKSDSIIMTNSNNNVCISLDKDNEQSILLASDECKESVAWLSNKEKDRSSLILKNSGTIAIKATSSPCFHIGTKNKGWFKIHFSKQGLPTFTFSSGDEKDQFTLTAEDFRKLKKTRFPGFKNLAVSPEL